MTKYLELIMKMCIVLYWKDTWIQYILVGRLYKQKIVEKRKCLGGLNICIYSGLNGSSFYQVGACLQAESFHED